MDRQSPDIAQGVDTAHEGRVTGSEDPLDEDRRYDQGNDVRCMRPTSRSTTCRLRSSSRTSCPRSCRRSGTPAMERLHRRPDGKTQVTVRYDDAGMAGREVEKVLISTQHQDGVGVASCPRRCGRRWCCTPGSARRPVRPGPGCKRRVLHQPDRPVHHRRPGRRHRPRPAGRSSSTPTAAARGKAAARLPARTRRRWDCVDASAARYVAKNIVAAGLRRPRRGPGRLRDRRAARPLFPLLVETFGTEKISRKTIVELVQENFDLRPGAILRDLNLRRPGLPADRGPTVTSAAAATASPGSAPTRPTSSGCRLGLA